MKTPTFVAVLGLVFFLPVFARGELSFAKVQGALAGVPPPEIPVRAAKLVLQANNDEKQSATTNVVLAVVEMNPCTVPSTVAQIARTSPAMAPLAAATAVSFQPNQIYLITKAAVGAAPAQISEIVSAIVDQIPSQYVVVADTASQVSPSAGTNILNGVTRSIPVLEPFVREMVAGNPPGEDLPVAAILNQSTLMALRSPSAPQPSPASATGTVFPTPGKEAGTNSMPSK